MLVGVEALEAFFAEGFDEGGVDVGRIVDVAAFLGGEMLDGAERIVAERGVLEEVERLEEIFLAAHGAAILSNKSVTVT